MEKDIRKRECRLAAVLIAGLVVLLGYWFFFSSNGYCHTRKEAAKMEYGEKQLLWRKSEKMTEQEGLLDGCVHRRALLVDLCADFMGHQFGNHGL